MTNKGGRPTKLTPEIQVELVKYIKAGNYYSDACEYVGIDYRTFRNWMKKGEEAKTGQFFQFFHAIKKAEAESKIRMVAQWQSAMKTDWKAIATFMERRYPEEWGRKDKHEVKHEGTIEVQQYRERILQKFKKMDVDKE